MTDETQGVSPLEDAPLSPPETEAADSSPAPVETPADDAPREQPRDEDGKFLSEKAQKRIDQLTWEKNEYLRRLQQLEYQQQQKPPEPPKQPPRLPTLEEVAYDEAKYQAALLEYATKQAEVVVEKRLS
jgi:hypothetical protein